MTSLKEGLIHQLDSARARRRDVEVHTALTAEQISDLAKRSGPLPGEVRDLLAYAGGCTVDGFTVSFSGTEAFEFEDILPRGAPVATDGAGNFWVVDVQRDGTWGAVLFVSHDPPVVVVQASGLRAFLDEVFNAEDVSGLAERYVVDIWKRNPFVMNRSQALSSKDEALRSFAEQVSENFVISDLRHGVTGEGFVWGLAGPDTEVRRHQDGDLLFAIQTKPAGLFSRLFSR